MPPENESQGTHDEVVDHEAEGAVIGRALRTSLLVAGVIAIAIACVVAWLRRPPEAALQPPEPVRVATKRNLNKAELPQVPFTNITLAAGIDFVPENGAYGEKLLPETMGGGCAFLDYDNDSDQDLLLIGGCHWPGHEPTADIRSSLALYRNDGKGNFDDVTVETHLDVSLYGMGVGVGDYDNDGDTDLYITAVGKNRLFRNEGPERGFVDVTEVAGVGGGDQAWSTSCSWADYDNDGDLDLFVCNYIQWSREIDLAQNFTLLGVGRAYGPPTGFAGSKPALYRNDGDGTFSEVTREAGLGVVNEATGEPVAKSLALAPVDLDQDGWIDFIVANDTVQNFVFHNLQNGTFEEIGTTAGIAYDSAGKARGAMGIDTLQTGSQGDVAVVIGNFANEMTAFYCTHGDPLFFADEAIATGIGPQTRRVLTFGVMFVDIDLDGRRDLLAVNGHLEEEIGRVQESQLYRQAAQLFFNRSHGSGSQFVLAAQQQLGTDFFTPMVGRGAAYADIDADGDLDLLFTQIGGPPMLLRNEQKLGQHWIRLKLVGKQANRSAIGAAITVTSGDRKIQQQVMPTRSYLSQTELPVTIGLGKQKEVDEVIIRWPSGMVQQVENVTIDGVTVVEQHARR